MCAAHERRHNTEHMSTYISVRDLIEDVKKDLEPVTPIPSESTVLFAFGPKNAYLHTAKNSYCSGRVILSHKKRFGIDLYRSLHIKYFKFLTF